MAVEQAATEVYLWIVQNKLYIVEIVQNKINQNYRFFNTERKVNTQSATLF